MTAKPTEFWNHPVPAIYPQAYLNLLRDRGGDVEAVIRESGLTVDANDRALGDIEPLQMLQLMRGVIDQIGNPALGIEIGLRLPPTAFGNLGYALLCSATLEDAIRLCHRFWPLVGREIDQSLSLESPTCSVELSVSSPLPEPLDRMAIESTIASFYRGLQLLVDVRDEDLEIWFSGDPPPYASLVYAKIPSVRYNMPCNQFRFSARLLQEKLSMHNPTALKFAIRQCEREEALLTGSLHRVREKVRQEMTFGRDGYPTLHMLANILNMTSRTLRRRLEQEGTNYKLLLEEAKRRDAIKLLDDRQFEIQRIAGLLGYQDPANFTRAFRQWTGQTPSQYRITRATSGSF